MSVTFGFLSGRVCCYDAALGFTYCYVTLLPLLKHQPHFIKKPCINVGVRTSTHTPGNVFAFCDVHIHATFLINEMLFTSFRQSKEAFKNKHFLSKVLREVLVFYLPRGRESRDTFMLEYEKKMKMGFFPQLCTYSSILD